MQRHHSKQLLNYVYKLAPVMLLAPLQFREQVRLHALLPEYQTT